MQSTFTHLSFAHVYKDKNKKQTSFPKKDWSCKRALGKSLNPLKDNLLLIFMNPGFNFFTFSLFPMFDMLAYPKKIDHIRYFRVVVFFLKCLDIQSFEDR
jgi:hypothetical protein